MACQTVNDLQPQPDDLPESVVQLLRDEFPGYEKITVSPLEKDRVWNARLTMDTSTYDLVVSRQKILSTFRLSSNTVPGGLPKEMNGTILDGGKFSDFREKVRESGEYPNKEFSARYTWNSSEFFTDWTNLIPKNGRIDFYPDVDVKYYTEDLNDLPADIQQIIARKINEARLHPKIPRPLEFWNARVYYHKNKKKSYEISFGIVRLEIGQNGQVIFWDFGEGQDAGFDILLNQADVPKEIISYIQNDPVASTFPGFLAVRFSDSGKPGYRIVLSNNRLSYILYFDESSTLVRHFFEKAV